MRLSGEFSHHCPLKINCGSHALAGLPVELARCGARRPLILADSKQVGKKRVKRVTDAFQSSGLTVAIYHGLSDPPEPDRLSTLFGLYQDGGCDSLIAVGCDAVVDAAKCLNVLIAAHERQNESGSGQCNIDAGPMRPLLLVATPGGDGNEATHYASDGNGLLRTDRLMPSVVFIDPVMMDSPTPVVINGAMIGLAHAIEAFLDPAAGPLARAQAHAAIGMIRQHLLPAITSAERRIHIGGVVCGQTVAGCAFSVSSPGACHTLAARLSAFTDAAPGYLMAILLPHLLAEVAHNNADAVGRLLYPMAGAQAYALTAGDLRALRATAWVLEFYDRLNASLAAGFPTTLTHAGVTDDQLRQARAGLGPLANDDIMIKILDQAC